LKTKDILIKMPAVLSRPVTIVVFGHVGNGKSTFCNTLIGDNTGLSFKESAAAAEETLETVGKEGMFDGVRVCAIDTPGYGGAEGNTAKHIVNMADFIIKNTDVQVFVLVLNYQFPRFDEEMYRFFQLITGMYPGESWLNHLAIVWTRYYPEHSNDEEKNERMKTPKVGIRTFKPDITDDQLNAIPQYFIDSKDTRTPGNPGRNEIAHLLAWAVTKPPLKTLGDMRVKKGDPIIEKRDHEVAGEVWETGYHFGGHKYPFGIGPRAYHHDVHQRFTKIFEERQRQEYTSGEPTYTEWAQVRTEVTERIIHQYDT